MKKQFSTFIILLLINSGFLYPQDISVSPNQAYPGETKNLYIAGNGTNFQDGVTVVSFDDPTAIAVVSGSTEVTNSFSLNTRIIIDNNAIPGPYSFTITTNSEILIGSFDVLETSGETVILTIIPADPLYLSSFDPDDPQNSPMVFLIEIINDEVVNYNVVATFTLSNDEYGGVIGTATKRYDSILGNNGSVQFDNREFDEYNISSTAGTLLDEAMQTGMLPPGEYVYQISVTSDQGDMGEGDEGTNIVTNLIFSIDLIGPGNSLNYSPEVIYSPNPYFQWFSMANSYDITLYEVIEGQTVPDEITTNLPEYEELSYGTTELLYPTYAELLEVGKTYAWQVKAYFDGSMGQETIYSDVFWFSYQEGGMNVLDHIEVIPDEVTLNTGESYQFYAVGFDMNGDTVQVDCEWQVVPATGGVIDYNGSFAAGHNPITFAVVAQYEGLQAYSTVTTNWTGFSERYIDVWYIINNTFGLSDQ